MLRKFLSDIAFMQLVNLLIKPIWIFVIDRKVQDMLPAEVYGNYFALFNFSLIFFIVLDLGLNNFNITQVARDEKKIRVLTGGILGLKILLSFVYVVLAFVVGSMIGYDVQEFQLLILLCVLQIITSFNQYLRSIVASLQKFKWDGVFMVLDRAIMVILCSLLIWGGISGFDLSIDRFVYAQIIGVASVFVVLLLFLKNRLIGVKLSFNLKTVFPLLKRSWPFALLIAFMGMYNYLDGVMLKSLVGDEEAGTYALGYRLFYALLMFAQIFSGVLLPFFSKNISNAYIINRISNYTAKLLLFIGFTVAFVSFAFSNEIIELLYPQKASVSSSESYGLLMFGFIGSALILVYGTLLTAGLQLKQMNFAALFTLILNVILNLWLIPIYGAKGAAIATVSSQLVFGLSCFFVSYRRFKFPMKTIQVLLQFVGLSLLFVMTVILKQYLESLVVHLVMITLTVIISAYLFKLFERKHLKTVLRK